MSFCSCCNVHCHYHSYGGDYYCKSIKSKLIKLTEGGEKGRHRQKDCCSKMSSETDRDLKLGSEVIPTTWAGRCTVETSSY